MTPNIFGERFLGRDKPGWHAIGNTFSGPMTAKAAFEKSGLNYEMAKQPVVVQVQTLFGTEIVTVPDKMAIVREPTQDDPQYRVFGFVGPHYGLIQNMDIAATIDQLTDVWPVETVGALSFGETMFATLKTDDFEIGGDQLRGYFLVTNTSDGGHTLQIAFTPVRVVCQNTLVSGLREASVSAAIQHNSTAKDDLDARVKLLASLQKAEVATIAKFRALAACAINMEQAQTIFKAAYPIPTTPKTLQAVDGVFTDDELPEKFRGKVEKVRHDFERDRAIAVTRQEAAWGLFQKYNDEFPQTAGTAWAAWQAVTEGSDWRDGDGNPDASLLFGKRAGEKTRAMASAMAYVQVR